MIKNFKDFLNTVFIYLFGCIRCWWWHVRSWLHHADLWLQHTDSVVVVCWLSSCGMQS